MASDDAVAVLLKGHLWVESALTDLIRADLELPDEWPDLQRLSFPSKVGLARAQGALYLGSELLLALNRVRNRLAHDVAYEVDDTTATALLNAFPKVPEELRAEDPECAPHLPSTLTPDTQAVIVLREIVVSLLTHLYTLNTEVLKARAVKMQKATQKLNALIQAKDTDDS